jgi:Antitoxin component of bacterial toxin-antitoxin system, MqsA
LSQAEAGELRGGGPRAFTKYESGTIKPAASVTNILRLLDANPAVLATLSGRKTVPIDSDGGRPFEVTGRHIEAMTDRKLMKLTRRLLAAEAQSGDLPMDGIHVAAGERRNAVGLACGNGLWGALGNERSGDHQDSAQGLKHRAGLLEGDDSQHKRDDGV